MDAPYFSTSLPSILLISFFIILTVLLLPPSYCIDDDLFYMECAYNCGSFRNIPFPFWIDDDRPDNCWHKDKEYELKCPNNEYPVLQFDELKFRVLNFIQFTSRMTIARVDLRDNLCPEKRLTTVLDYTWYDYSSTVKNITLFYNCSRPSLPGIRFECSPGARNISNYFVDDSWPGINRTEFTELCDPTTVKVPVSNSTFFNDHEDSLDGATLLMKALEKGFEVEYNQSLMVACSGCELSGGRCGSNITSQFVCFCRDGGQSPFLCSDGMHIFFSALLAFQLDVSFDVELTIFKKLKQQYF
ncbi:hypothetical protein CIPAW_15G133000 [Carya illinoinensis]|uniref:non-specific serine/threonine protein kinase n=1 Tax=Carya illinoinensis TaxID=32201 RepID=A0A8T1NEU1_CARIL|nr:hypothetical protein CIPAW_15G133000 [Carya illinoinensis]